MKREEWKSWENKGRMSSPRIKSLSGEKVNGRMDKWERERWLDMNSMTHAPTGSHHDRSSLNEACLTFVCLHMNTRKRATCSHTSPALSEQPVNQAALPESSHNNNSHSWCLCDEKQWLSSFAGVAVVGSVTHQRAAESSDGRTGDRLNEDWGNKAISTNTRVYISEGYSVHSADELAALSSALLSKKTH